MDLASLARIIGNYNIPITGDLFPMHEEKFSYMLLILFHFQLQGLSQDDIRKRAEEVVSKVKTDPGCRRNAIWVS